MTRLTAKQRQKQWILHREEKGDMWVWVEGDTSFTVYEIRIQAFFIV